MSLLQSAARPCHYGDSRRRCAEFQGVGGDRQDQGRWQVNAQLPPPEASATQLVPCAVLMLRLHVSSVPSRPLTMIFDKATEDMDDEAALQMLRQTKGSHQTQDRLAVGMVDDPTLQVGDVHGGCSYPPQQCHVLSPDAQSSVVGELNVAPVTCFRPWASCSCLAAATLRMLRRGREVWVGGRGVAVARSVRACACARFPTELSTVPLLLRIHYHLALSQIKHTHRNTTTIQSLLYAFSAHSAASESQAGGWAAGGGGSQRPRMVS